MMYTHHSEVPEDQVKEIVEYYKTHRADDTAKKFSLESSKIVYELVKTTDFRKHVIKNKRVYKKNLPPLNIVTPDILSKPSDKDTSKMGIATVFFNEKKVDAPLKKNKMAVFVTENPQDIIDILRAL